MMVSSEPSAVAAIDLFCGAGGLSLGLKQAGVEVIAGLDLDPACQYPYEQNLKAKFLPERRRRREGTDLQKLWPEGKIRLLAGCAPCQPFSSHRRGANTRARTTGTSCLTSRGSSRRRSRSS